MADTITLLIVHSRNGRSIMEQAEVRKKAVESLLKTGQFGAEY